MLLIPRYRCYTTRPDVLLIDQIPSTYTRYQDTTTYRMYHRILHIIDIRDSPLCILLLVIRPLTHISVLIQRYDAILDTRYLAQIRPQEYTTTERCTI